MAEEYQPAAGVQVASLILIVTGAHLRAEMADRPLAYRLQKSVEGWLAKHAAALAGPLRVLVCSDIWFMNQPAVLHARPTISVGGPGVNALSAFFYQKLPHAPVHDAETLIQLDPEFTDLRACVWGMNHESTAAAVDRFIDEFLPAYLRAVATQVEPSEE
ncbi:MAG: hypothetical protein K8S99_09820 [Planctomycetes bacterium]|nr:hypothetical protein [Planctomycetota bacterium]